MRYTLTFWRTNERGQRTEELRATMDGMSLAAVVEMLRQDRDRDCSVDITSAETADEARRRMGR